MQSEQEDGEVEVDVAVSDGFVHVEEEVEVDGGSDVVGAGDEGGSVGSSETGSVLVGDSLEEEPTNGAKKQNMKLRLLSGQ